MSVSARLQVDWSRNFDYIARKRSVTGDRRQTDDRQTDNGVYRAARSQLKILPMLSFFFIKYANFSGEASHRQGNQGIFKRGLFVVLLVIFHK